MTAATASDLKAQEETTWHHRQGNQHNQDTLNSPRRKLLPHGTLSLCAPTSYSSNEDAHPDANSTIGYALNTKCGNPTRTTWPR
jgi:hypothetical protein